MTCFECGEGTFKRQVAQVQGEVKRKKYMVEMLALVCDACGHITLEGRDTQEFMRRVADTYRREHGLMTSDDIRNLRGRMSQQSFAHALGLGVASIKRWELGLIQDKKSNKVLVDFATKSVPRAHYRFDSYDDLLSASRMASIVETSAHGPPCALEHVQPFHPACP